MRKEIQVPYADLARGPGSYTFRRDILAVWREGAIALDQINTVIHVTKTGMEGLVNLELKRRSLVGSDPVFHAVTAPMMSSCFDMVREIQNGLFRTQQAHPYYSTPQHPAQYGGQW